MISLPIIVKYAKFHKSDWNNAAKFEIRSHRGRYLLSLSLLEMLLTHGLTTWWVEV